MTLDARWYDAQDDPTRAELDAWTAEHAPDHHVMSVDLVDGVAVMQVAPREGLIEVVDDEIVTSPVSIPLNKCPSSVIRSLT